MSCGSSDRTSSGTCDGTGVGVALPFLAAKAVDVKRRINTKTSTEARFIRDIRENLPFINRKDRMVPGRE